MEFEWNIFPGFTTLQLCNKVHELMTKMGDPSQCKGRIIFMSMFNDIMWRSEDNDRNVLLTPHLCLYLQNDFQQDIGHSSDLDQKQSGILLTTKDQKENGTESLNRWTPSFPSHESIVSRKGQKQRRWKIINTLLCRWAYD